MHIAHYSYEQVESRYCKREKVNEIPKEIHEQALKLAKFILTNRDGSLYIQESIEALKSTLKQEAFLEGKTYALALRTITTFNCVKELGLPRVETVKQTDGLYKEKISPYVRLFGTNAKAYLLKDKYSAKLLKCLILDQIEKGSYNTVFYGYDTERGTPHAFRFLSDAHQVNESALKKWEQEVIFQKDLKAKNVPHTLEVDSIFHQVLNENSSLVGTIHPYYESSFSMCPPEDLIAAAIAILEGVKGMHRLGYIHGDLKPGNILFNSQSKEIRICDFGEKCLFKDLDEGKMGGTIDYEMPESYYLKPKMPLNDLGEAIDIAALGLTLYEVKYKDFPSEILALSETLLIPHRNATVQNEEYCLNYIEESYPDIFKNHPTKNVRELMDEVLVSLIVPEYEKVYNKLIQTLNATQDPLDAIIAKMIFIDPVKRLKVDDALTELKKLYMRNEVLLHV